MSTDIAAPAAAAPDPRGEKRTPSTIVDMPREMVTQKFGSVSQRKYASWTWVPSQGFLYGAGKFPGGEVVVSPMTVSDEKILAGGGGKDKTEIIDTIVQRCLLSCPVPYEELLIPDMLYLLLVIRNITYGASYTFRLECPKCSQEHVSVIDLPGGLELRCLDETDDGEPWEVVLPNKDRINWRLLRIKDESDIRRWSRKAYSRSQQVGDPGYAYRLSKHITAINGQPVDGAQKLLYVEDLIGRDSLALRNAIQSKEFGVRLLLDSTCPACGHVEKTRLPFDREFFHPGDGASET